MATWCLPPGLADAFTSALQSGEINVEKMATMESPDRRALLAIYVGKEHAAEVNALFEKKLLLKNWQRGMISWIKSAAGISEPAQRDMVNKVLKMERLLNPDDEKAFLADYVAKKLGMEVTVKETKKITELAQAAVKARESNTGATFGMSEDFAKAASALEHYVKSLKPTTVVAEVRDNVITTLRNFVLMNPSTPIKTTIGQIENSAIEAVMRRIGARTASGAAPEAKAELQKEAWKFFRDTGFNPSIMENYEDSGRLGEHHNFDTPEGMLTSSPALRKIEQTTRTIAKISNKIAIDYEHVITFTKFHQMAFFDAAHIGATNIATAKGLSGAAQASHAEALLRDASRIKPETEDGKILRADAQQQAARVTSINDTYLGEFALQVKRILNGGFQFQGKNVPRIGLGDLIMPVAKIPANIVWNGIENAGVGIPMAFNDLLQGKQKLKSDDAKTRAEGMMQYASGWRRMARVVGVMGASALFASMFDKKDFKIDRYGATYVKIGGLWINMEYISFMSPAMAGFLNVKKEVHRNDSVVKTVEMYGAGATKALSNAPGVETVSNFVTSINSNKDKVAGAWEYLKGRMVPAPIHNMFRDRPVNRLLFGAHGVENDAEVREDKHQDHQRAAQRRHATAEYRAE